MLSFSAYSISSTTTVPAQLILWSRFANDSADVQTITLDQTSDLTSSFNEYSFLFEHSQTESSIVEHSVVVKLNGARIAVMHGIPFLSFDTRLIFHAWNRDGKVPPVDKVFDPPIAVMYVRDVKVSRKVNGPCAHGSPFYDWTAPFVEFQAAVGSRPLLNDVVEFRVRSFHSLQICTIFYCIFCIFYLVYFSSVSSLCGWSLRPSRM